MRDIGCHAWQISVYRLSCAFSDEFDRLSAVATSAGLSMDEAWEELYRCQEHAEKSDPPELLQVWEQIKTSFFEQYARHIKLFIQYEEPDVKIEIVDPVIFFSEDIGQFEPELVVWTVYG